jgi:hypothetical protein
MAESLIPQPYQILSGYFQYYYKRDKRGKAAPGAAHWATDADGTVTMFWSNPTKVLQDPTVSVTARGYLIRGAAATLFDFSHEQPVTPVGYARKFSASFPGQFRLTSRNAN